MAEIDSMNDAATVNAGDTSVPGFGVEDMVAVRLAALPAVIREYLVSKRIAEANRRLAATHKLSGQDMGKVYVLELQVFFGLLGVNDFVDELWTEIGWPDSEEDRARLLMLDILGNVFLPARSYLGDVASVISELDGNPADYTAEPLGVREVTYVQGTQEVVGALGTGFVDPAYSSRLAHIIETRLRDVRDDADTKAQLMRPNKVGGLEMSNEQANKVLEVLSSEMRMTHYVEAVKASASPVASSDAVIKTYTPEQIAAIYTGDASQAKQLREDMDKFIKVTDRDPMKMRDALHELLYPPSLDQPEGRYVIAATLALSEDGELPDFLRNDDRFIALLRKHLQSIGDSQHAGDLEYWSATPEAFNVFLQLLLRGFAGLDGNESARLGLKAINSLKKSGRPEYAGLVAFDKAIGKFRWLSEIKF